MAAFKSNRAMRLSGKTARRWARRIRAEKAQQHGGKTKRR